MYTLGESRDVTMFRINFIGWERQGRAEVFWITCIHWEKVEMVALFRITFDIICVVVSFVLVLVWFITISLN